MSGTIGRSKKPKETPKNLQWNNFQKNLAVAQTSFLQYFGKRESKQVPKEFSVANAKVKKLQENFEELVKASKYYIKASQGIDRATEIYRAIKIFLTITCDPKLTFLSLLQDFRPVMLPSWNHFKLYQRLSEKLIIFVSIFPIHQFFELKQLNFELFTLPFA